MKNRQDLGHKTPAQSGVHFVQALFASLFNPAPRVEALVRIQRNVLSRMVETGADACWTASLHRGDDLPPFLLSIRTAADSPSALRMEPFADRRQSRGIGGEI